MMSIWHLLWVVPLSAVIGYVVSRFFTAVDLERSLEEGEDFQIMGITIKFNEVVLLEEDNGQD